MRKISWLEQKSAGFAPIVVSGLTGAGKDTITSGICRFVQSNVQGIIGADNFRTSNCRFTDRPRRPDEIDGVHGRFVGPAEFDELLAAGEFFFSYQKGAYDGVRYGFSATALKEETNRAHTFIVGGEIGTAISLFQKLDDWTREEGADREFLPPILLFVNRPTADAVISGLNSRRASEDEVARRVGHIRANWVLEPEGLQQFREIHPDRTLFVLNNDLDTAVKATADALDRVINDLRVKSSNNHRLSNTA